MSSHKERAVIFSVVNQKGGVGKTTTAVNLATAFAAAKKRVLLIDADPQGNASTGFGISSGQRQKTIYEIYDGKKLVGRATFQPTFYKSKYSLVDSRK